MKEEEIFPEVFKATYVGGFMTPLQTNIAFLIHSGQTVWEKNNHYQWQMSTRSKGMKKTVV